MSFEIHRANNRDGEAVASVIKAVYDEYNFTWDPEGYHADLYDIEGHYDACGDSFFVGLLDNVVIGTVGLSRFELLPGTLGEVAERDGYVRVLGTDCSLERLYVHPDARRVGAGSRLVAHVVEAAKAERRAAMEIWSDKRFEDAHRLYGRFGAQVAGDRICDDPDASPEWGLLLTL